MGVYTGNTFDEAVRDFYPQIRRRAPSPAALPLFGSAREIRDEANTDYIDDGWGSFGNEVHQERRAAIAGMADAEVVRRYGIMEPLGCGSYGCVYATGDPRWVFKVTTDKSEAHFIALLEHLSLAFPGVAAYGGVYLLPGGARPTYALWREAATVIGLGAVAAWIEARPELRLDQYALGASELLLYAVLTIGRDMFSIAERWAEQSKSYLVERAYALFTSGRLTAPAGSGKLGSYLGLLQAYEGACRKMQRDPLLRLVGRSLLDLLQRGITLNDLHANNVGLTARSTPFLVITDPGHVIPLTNAYQHIRPQRI